MKIAVFGASGMIGSRIVNEALTRKHQITAVTRDPGKLSTPNVTVVQGDLLDPASIAAVVKGHEAVISAYGPGPGGDPQEYSRVAHALIDGLTQAGVKRLIVVGGAGSLEVSPGLKRYDTPDFPDAWRALSKATGAALEIFKTCDLDWTYISPADMIAPGERTGHYRVGGDQMLYDADGKSFISAEDYAVGLLDEVEHPQAVQRRITFAY